MENSSEEVFGGPSSPHMEHSPREVHNPTTSLPVQHSSEEATSLLMGYSSEKVCNNDAQKFRHIRIILSHIRNSVSIEWLIHGVAIGITVITTQFCWRRAFWVADEQWELRWYGAHISLGDLMKLLQYPAKLHEICLVTSISAIVLHFMLQRLMDPTGIAFGLVLGAYETDSVEYLFSGKLWPSLVYGDAKPLAWLILLMVLLTQVLGPASAGVMQPNLAWYNVSKPFNGEVLPLYINTKLYPTVLDSSYTNQHNLTYCLENADDSCPNSGFQQINTWARSNAKIAAPLNIIMTDPFSQTQRSLSTTLYGGGEDEAKAVALTTSADITRVYGYFWSYIQQSRSPGAINSIRRPMFTSPQQTYGPMVQVQCYSDDIDSVQQLQSKWVVKASNLTDFTPTGASPYSYSWTVPSKLWNTSNTNSSVSFTWIDVDTNRTGSQPSIGALAAIPWRYENGTMNTQKQILAACIIDARWAAAHVSYDPTTSSQISSNLSNASTIFDDQSATSLKYGIGNPIRITSDWASLLNARGQKARAKNQESSPQEENLLTNVTAIEKALINYVAYMNVTNTFLGTFDSQVVAYDLDIYKMYISQTVAEVLSLIVADGMALATSYADDYIILNYSDSNSVNAASLSFQTGFSRNSSQYPVSKFVNWTMITLEVQQYGWGYGLSKIVYFNIAVLYLHTGLAISYGFYRLGRRFRGRSSYSTVWGDSAELLKLAMTSDNSEAMRMSHAWQQRIHICDDGSHKLEVVPRDPVDGGDKVPNPTETYVELVPKYTAAGPGLTDGRVLRVR